jgi:very-short-patch-repair endonuclease
VRYFADILIPELNVIVEFMGNYWHCNPTMYEENYWHKKKGLCAKEIWEADKTRKEMLETFGYNVFPVWESDYTKNKDQVITLLKEKIDAYRKR